MGLKWTVSFEDRRLAGEAIAWLVRSNPNAPLVLDTRGLDIEGVDTASAKISTGEHGTPELAIGSLDPAWTPAEFTLGNDEPGLGQSLTVPLSKRANLVRIRYRTRPEASGLQWLQPSQTAGKLHPFLYSQSQAIHGRSWIPCQDSPGIRFTFDAQVTVPSAYTAVMAAEMLDAQTPREADGLRTYRFVMPQRIPAYLLAIGVGDLTQRELGSRSAVWADPQTIDAAHHEFADVERMLTAAEKLYGTYPWGRYDILVLPPAFPFGGMENPRLTFATPTILAGDRSLVSLVAHELAHSWSGNLVTNATWQDLWLNEGFTVYFERRIVESIFGRDREEMEAMLGRQDLEDELGGELKDRPGDQILRIDLTGRDPDDNFSNVPYEKGALFLRALEETYGRERFDEFLRGWFERNAFGSVSTNDFLQYLRDDLMSVATPLGGKTPPNVHEWVDRPGLPDDAPRPTSNAFTAVDGQVEAFLAGTTVASELKTDAWTPHQWLHFLRALPDDIGLDAMAQLDAAFRLTASTNSEIVAQWLALAAKRRYEPAYERLESFLVRVGRRKFLTPLYRALVETEDGKAQALAIYAKARPGYHAISRTTIDEVVQWSPTTDTKGP